MKEHILERLLPMTRPAGREPTAFTKTVMRQVRRRATFDAALRTTTATKRGAFMNLLKLHKVASLAIAALILSLVSFTGYSYAIGSNPVSVLKRWATGDHVQVEYNGHTFTYGDKMQYSDAAISAFAELDLVDEHYALGNNFFTVPKNGIEYVTDPTVSNSPDAYVFPWIGTIQRVTDTSVIIEKQFVSGDKMRQNQSIDETVTLPLSDLSYLIKGDPANPSSAAVGTVVKAYQNTYIKHYIGTTKPLEHITHYFVYQLTHTLDEVKEASQQPPTYSDPTTQPIQDYQFGLSDEANLCYDNSADICDHEPRGGDGSQGLFTNSVDPNTGKDYGPKSNPAAVNFGQGSPEGTSHTMIIRDMEGVVTAITSANFTIKTSSGAQWTFAYSTTQQQVFANEFGALKVGDHINGAIVAPLNDLDNRTIDTAHIYQLTRYKS